MVSASSKLNTYSKIKDKFPFNLVIIFLILSIGVILFGYYYYISLRDRYFSREESEIRFQSDLKSKLIETWLNERIKHANSIPKNKLRISEINSFLNNPESQSQKEDLSEWLGLLLEQYGYKHAALYDKNLKPLISVPVNTNIDEDFETERIRRYTLINGTVLSDLFLNNSDSALHMNIFVNIQSAENKEKPGAVLIFDIDLQTYLLPALLQIPSEHRTMESLVAQKEGDHILFLNELKFKQQTALKFKIPLTDTSIIAVKAALGKEGITYGKDYMHKDVLACINKIKGTPWFIITKIDMDELNEPILKRTAFILINVIIAILITGIFIILIWKRQKDKHYKQLYEEENEELTERKKAEEELRKSEERFSLAFKLSPIAMSLTKLSDGTFININDAFVKLLGFTYEDVKGLKTTDMNIWDKELRESTISKLKTTGLIRDLELKIRNKDGNEIDTITTIQIINIGGEDCIISMVQDITEKKKAEEQVRKLSRAVEQSSASIIITDLKGDIEYVNPKFSEMSGYEAQEAIGKNPRILKSGKNPEELYVDLWKTISSGREWHGELQNKRKDGNFYWEWASISPVFDSKGTITNYLAVKEDITINKLIQDQIHLQAILLENITDAVISTDEKFIIKSWNLGAEKMYGWKAQEVVNKNLENFVKTEFVNDNLVNALKYVNQHDTWLGEVSHTTKNRKKISILASTSTLRNEKGEITGYVSVNRDITERKQQEEKIKNSLKEKEILLKEIHHRVKNNLQVISSLLKMQSAYIKDPLSLEYFKISSQRVKSMALIHEQLYRSADLSKIDFENYIKKLSIHLYQTYGVNSSKVQFIVNVKDIMLSIDSAIPCGLLVNELISNSLKHAFTENKIGRIEVEMTSNENTYILKVKDTGSGFPENINFLKTETLGMQLVNTLVEQIEGTIELKNDPGTEFIITFKSNEYKKRI